MPSADSAARRLARALVLAALAGSAGAIHAAEPAYPQRPVRMIVAQSTGGNADFVARAFATRLSERFGQQVVVDNRPGGGGVIATETAVRAAPDGYTLLLAPTAHAINPAIIRRLPYDTQRDLAPVSQLGRGINLLVVNMALPVKSAADLIALARARPGKLHFASSGFASSTHLAGEYFGAAAGVSIVHVPYKGASAALVDLIAGQVEMIFASMPTVMTLVRAGKVRALAVTSLERTALLPDMPTLVEAGLAGFENTIWQALFAPRGTPAAIIDRLHRELAAIARQPDVRERMMAEGSEPVGGTPQELDRFVAAELERWAKIVRIAGLKPQ